MDTRRKPVTSPNFFRGFLFALPVSMLIWAMLGLAVWTWGWSPIAKVAAAGAALYLLWRLLLLALWIFVEARYHWRMRDPVYRANREAISSSIAGIGGAAQQVSQDWRRLLPDGRIITSVSVRAEDLHLHGGNKL